MKSLSNLRSHSIRILTLFALMSALLLPAHAADELTFSDKRVPNGEYTATLDQMALRRLSAYGFLDDSAEDTEDAAEENSKETVLPMRLDGTPDRLDGALMLYRVCGTTPENPVRFTDVPEEYVDAVSWLYAVGATKGIGNQMFGTGELTEEQFIIMLSRLLNWGTDDPTLIPAVMEKRGLAPMVPIDGAFTFGEMYEMVCGLLDYAYPSRCAPIGEKELTPSRMEITADSCSDAMVKLRKAISYLPKRIEVAFSDTCPDEEQALFRENLSWSGGKKTMPLLELMNPRWNLPFSMEPTAEAGHYLLTVSSYSQAAEAAASATNWLQVFQDENYSTCLRDFYLTHIFPLKGLGEYGRVIQSHDLLCRLASYDYSEYDDVRKVGTGARPKAHDMVGFLENQKVVCDGYANVYSWMLLELGVDSYLVHGRANGGGHAWNKVCVDGKWYNVDACWDDTGPFLRRYFLKSDEWMTEHEHCFTDAFSASTFQSVNDYA